MTENDNLHDKEMIYQNRLSNQQAQQIKRIAYQNGVASENVNAFLEQLKLRLPNDSSPNNSQLMLYQAAAAQLNRLGGLQNDGGLLGFQEDRDSHLALQKLPLKARFLVLLHLVDGRPLSFAAEALQMEQQEAEDAMKEAQDMLRGNLAIEDVEQLQQRLNFLAKSYERLKLPDSDAAPEHFEQANGPDIPSSPQKVGKPVKWAVGICLALLIASVGATFFLDSLRLPSAAQAEEGELSREKAEELERLYEDTRSAAKERLGMTEDQFSAFDYVIAADGQMESLFSRSSLQQHQHEADSFEWEVRQLLWKIDTPKGMSESIEGTVSLPAEEMDLFLQIYVDKTRGLQGWAQDILKSHQELLPAASAHYGGPQLLLEDIPQAPKELEQLLVHWGEYGLRFRLADPERLYLLAMDAGLLQQLPQINTHPFASFYVHILSAYPYFDEQAWLVEPAQLTDPFLSMSYLLLEEPTDSVLKDDIEVMYAQMFWQIVKGDEQELYEEGQLKTEIRELWKSLASFDPIAAILLPVLQEMEQSGWRQSDALDNLKYETSLEMLELEREGKLSASLPNGDFPLEAEIVDLVDFDYSRVKELYERFSASHDRKVLASVQPMDIYLLYFYANRLEDAETMWHLQTDSELKPGLSEYTAEWEALPEPAEEARWVEITEGSEQRILEKLVINPSVANDGTIEYTYGTNPLQLSLVTESDHIWLVQYELEESAKGRNMDLEEQGRKAYSELAAKEQLSTETAPLIVAYALLHAIDEEDGAVAKQLVLASDDQQEAQFWRNYASSHQIAGFENMETIVFSASDLNARETAMGNLEIHYKTEDGEQWREYLQMIQTPEGWRFALHGNY